MTYKASFPLVLTTNNATINILYNAVTSNRLSPATELNNYNSVVASPARLPLRGYYGASLKALNK